MLHINDGYQPPSSTIQPPSPIVIFQGAYGDHFITTSLPLPISIRISHQDSLWPGGRGRRVPRDLQTALPLHPRAAGERRPRAAGFQRLGITTEPWESWLFIGKSCPLNYGPTIQVSELQSFTQNDVNIQENLWHHRHGMTETGEKIG